MGRDLSDILPERAVVDTAGKALLLAAAAIESHHTICIRPIERGLWEIRARDGVWLDWECKRL